MDMSVDVLWLWDDSIPEKERVLGGGASGGDGDDKLKRVYSYYFKYRYKLIFKDTAVYPVCE
jgi:hypothetical protein